jgi:crotonobetaine/carnitine-CoA ligase
LVTDALTESWTDLSAAGRERWTLPAVLAHQAEALGDRPFLRIEEEPGETFREMHDRSLVAARKLLTLGVAPGDRVLLMAGTSLDHIHTWFGINLIGAADVPLNLAYRSQTLSHGVNLAAAKVMVVDPEFLPVIRAVEDELHTLEVVVTLTPTDATLGRIPVVALADVEEDAATPLPTVKPSDIASVLYTSGTTGPAKGVLMAHAQCHTNAVEVIQGMRITADDVMFCFHPSFHMTGKFCAVWSCLTAGCELVLDRGFDPTTWIDHVRRYGATVTIGHGPMLEMIQAQPERPDDADNLLRVVLAAPFPAAIAHDFERRFQTRGMEIWGMTEVTCVSWPPYDAPLRLGSAGIPRADLFDVRIVDPETDEDLPAGTVGEITVRPVHPWTMMQGYLGMPEKTAAAWRNLRFHTGDAGFIDEDGYLHFIDRMGDRIRRRAENISSYDIEVAATSHALVAESAAVGVQSGFDNDDDIKLCIVAVAAAELDPHDVFQHLVAHLPHHMVPRYVEVLEALPRTPTNKVQKQKLRATGVSEGIWDRQALGISIRELRQKVDQA